MEKKANPKLAKIIKELDELRISELNSAIEISKILIAQKQRRVNAKKIESVPLDKIKPLFSQIDLVREGVVHETEFTIPLKIKFKVVLDEWGNKKTFLEEKTTVTTGDANLDKKYREFLRLVELSDIYIKRNCNLLKAKKSLRLLKEKLEQLATEYKIGQSELLFHIIKKMPLTESEVSLEPIPSSEL